MKFQITFATALTLTTLCLPLHSQAQSYLDAAQVKPILTATKNNWVAVREYNGQDLLYFTHLLAWRCGLSRIEYSLNNETEKHEWPLGFCDEDSANPNALEDGQQIYGNFPLKSLKTIEVFLTYDDATTDSARYDRKSIKIN